MNNQSLYAPIYDKSVMMHECQYHNDDGEITSRPYVFKCAIHVQEGDTVVAQTRGWYQLVTVTRCNVSIPVEDEERVYRWIVAKVDTHSHDTILEWEQQLVDEIAEKRIENMRQQMIAALGVQPNELTTLMSPDDDDCDNDGMVYPL